MKAPAFQLVAVELLDGFCGSRLLSKLDESEPSWTTSIAVSWQEYLYHLTHFRKQTFKLVSRRIVAQVSDEDLGANDDLLSVDC